MAEKREVTLSGADIDSTARKLGEFGKSLDPNEQVVVDWLLERAASAPPNDPGGDVKGFLYQPGGSASQQAFTPRLNQALGVGGVARPGDLAAVKITVSI
jgi:hypothetical protein